jgi:hypothetical protein
MQLVLVLLLLIPIKMEDWIEENFNDLFTAVYNYDSYLTKDTLLFFLNIL